MNNRLSGNERIELSKHYSSNFSMCYINRTKNICFVVIDIPSDAIRKKNELHLCRLITQSNGSVDYTKIDTYSHSHFNLYKIVSIGPYIAILQYGSLPTIKDKNVNTITAINEKDTSTEIFIEFCEVTTTISRINLSRMVVNLPIQIIALDRLNLFFLQHFDPQYDASLITTLYYFDNDNIQELYKLSNQVSWQDEHDVIRGDQVFFPSKKMDSEPTDFCVFDLLTGSYGSIDLKSTPLTSPCLSEVTVFGGGPPTQYYNYLASTDEYDYNALHLAARANSTTWIMSDWEKRGGTAFLEHLILSSTRQDIDYSYLFTFVLIIGDYACLSLAKTPVRPFQEGETIRKKVVNLRMSLISDATLISDDRERTELATMLNELSYQLLNPSYTFSQIVSTIRARFSHILDRCLPSQSSSSSVGLSTRSQIYEEIHLIFTMLQQRKESPYKLPENRMIFFPPGREQKTHSTLESTNSSLSSSSISSSSSSSSCSSTSSGRRMYGI